MSEEQKTILFVLEVEKYPCLYNTTLSGYSSRTETDKAWAEIGKKMKMTGAACKEKWRNIRVVYMRHIKPLPSGSGAKKKKPYYLLDYMEFLKPYVKPTIPPEAGNLPSTSSQETTKEINATAVTTDDLSIDVPCESEQSTRHSIEQENPAPPSSNPNRKKTTLHETDKHFINYLKQKSTRCETQTSTDSVMPFLTSLAPELREMNFQQFKIFKRRVFSLIDDIYSSTSQHSSTNNSIMSNQTIYSPISEYVEIGTPKPNPLDFSEVSSEAQAQNMDLRSQSQGQGYIDLQPQGQAQNMDLRSQSQGQGYIDLQPQGQAQNMDLRSQSQGQGYIDLQPQGQAQNMDSRSQSQGQGYIDLQPQGQAQNMDLRSQSQGQGYIDLQPQGQAQNMDSRSQSQGQRYMDLPSFE